jgi:glycerol-3-phosphate acyltransferase PlsX
LKGKSLGGEAGAEGKADAVVSAGSTGAQLAAAQVVLRRIKGISRAAIGSPFPTLKGIAILVDAGANPECDAKNLLQFAVMGSIYASEVLGRKNPTVGLVSNGTEETKGNTLVQEAHRLLQESGLNFIGNIEGRDVPSGVADVIVCDGFTGNVILKLAEGLGSGIFAMIKEEVGKGIRPQLGALLMKPGLKRVKARMDYTEYGGAPLLGVRGLSIICHGSSDAKAIKNAIRVAKEAVQRNVINRITSAAATSSERADGDEGAENDA